MSLPAISPIPLPPTTTDPESFIIRADLFLAALPVFQQQLNALIDALNPLVPDMPGLGEIVRNLEAIRLTGQNITSVNATGTGIVSVNAVAGTVHSGALSKVAEAIQSINALGPIAVDLAGLAQHITDFSELAENTTQLLKAVAEMQAILSAAGNIVELVAVGTNMPAIMGVYANIDAVKNALTAAVDARTAAGKAVDARTAAEIARDEAKGFAESASGIAGLPLGTEHNAPLVWNGPARRWMQGERVPLADPDAPGLTAADGTTLAVDRGVMRVKPEISTEAKPGTLVQRDASGKIAGDLTGTATPRSHVASHGKNGADPLTMELLGYSVSIPGEPDSLVKRNTRGKIEGLLETPQPPASHAASHSQEGADPLGLEALGVVISGADPTGTAARLWIKYF